MVIRSWSIIEKASIFKNHARYKFVKMKGQQDYLVLSVRMKREVYSNSDSPAHQLAAVLLFPSGHTALSLSRQIDSKQSLIRQAVTK